MTGTNKMTVSFGTITVTEKARRLIAEALDSTMLSSGKLVREYEERYAELYGVKHAVAVATGTAADVISLAALHDFGAARGDEIIVPSLSFIATGNAVLHAGFIPRFVDVEKDTFNIDPTKIEAAITEKTRAIMPVHLMGKPADMDAIMAIADRRSLYVIEDAAEAHGAVYKGRPAGGIGHMGAFSTYAAHIISTIEGGVIITNDDRFVEILRSLRLHGRDSTDQYFRFPRVGYSSKMNEIEAAVGIGNLDHHEEILAKRYNNLKYIMDRFDRFYPFLETFREEPYEKIGPHAFPIVIGEEASFSRDLLIQHLAENGIDSRTMFQSMATECGGFAFLGCDSKDFPNSERIAAKGIHIGVHQGLETEHMDYVLSSLESFLEAHQD